MAKTNWQDPGTSEIMSPHVSGLQEAVGKLEDSVGIETMWEEDIPMSEVYISETERNILYQAPQGKRNWSNLTTPVVKKNAVTISSGFTIDYGGGAIKFDSSNLDEDVITATVTYTKSTTLGEDVSDLANALDDLAGPGRTTETVVGAYAAAEAATPTPVIVNLPAANWITLAGLPTQTISLPGMVPEDLIVSCLPETLTLAQAKAIGKAMPMLRNQQVGSVDVVCLGTAPAIDVPFAVLWYGGDS